MYAYPNAISSACTHITIIYIIMCITTIIIMYCMFSGMQIHTCIHYTHTHTSMHIHRHTCTPHISPSKRYANGLTCTEWAVQPGSSPSLWQNSLPYQLSSTQYEVELRKHNDFYSPKNTGRNNIQSITLLIVTSVMPPKGIYGIAVRKNVTQIALLQV